ncbi:hypothetical protein GJ688_14930 [Heliobacillus mobilis]|uniref:Uncharacterized protein n=1 Tax=Heliobacterium mobile TaxID=28064 RepID=A0A6I3SMX6_HELMO|nr:hypothetical protein [Heliobacterium mobile]MTV50269.1 hypothetical protein [Heliobacterium mobile]
MDKDIISSEKAKRPTDRWNEISAELSDQHENRAERYWREVAQNGPSTDVAPFVQGTNTGSPKRLHPDRKTGDH